MGLLIDTGAMKSDFGGLAAVTLSGRHEPDAAVAVLLFVPILKSCHPQAGFAPARVWPRAHDLAMGVSAARACRAVLVRFLSEGGMEFITPRPLNSSNDIRSLT